MDKALLRNILLTTLSAAAVGATQLNESRAAAAQGSISDATSAASAQPPLFVEFIQIPPGNFNQFNEIPIPFIESFFQVVEPPPGF